MFINPASPMLRLAGCVRKLARTCPNEHFRSVFNPKTFKLLPHTQDINPYHYLGIACGNMRPFGVGSNTFSDNQTSVCKQSSLYRLEERQGSRSYFPAKYTVSSSIRYNAPHEIWLHRFSSMPRPREVWATAEIGNQT